MPRWAGALTWRCGFAAGRRRWSSGSWGRWRSATAAALVRVPGAKERALLADLLVNAGRVVSADRLVEDLWGEDPPGNPANTLQGRVSALRRALGPAGSGRLVTRPPGYVLEVDPEQVDAARFERLVAEAAALGPAERVAGGPAAGGGAGAVAGPRRWPSSPTAVGPGRGGPAGGAAPGRPRGPGRADPGRRRPRRAGGGAGGAGGRPPDPGAAAGPADGGAVPVGPPGRRAGAVPADPRGAGRGAGDRPVAGAAADCTRRSWSRPRPGGGHARPGPLPAQPARAPDQPGRAGGGAGARWPSWWSSTGWSR